MTPTLTDEQVVRVLAERGGIPPKQVQRWLDLKEAERAYQCAEIDADTYVKRCYFSGTPVPDYLTSRDALAPVLAGLSEEEWTKLLDILWVKCGCGFQPTRLDINLTFMRYLLTMPARDLAHAVAAVLVQGREGGK